jgi:hypothetical protein
MNTSSVRPALRLNSGVLRLSAVLLGLLVPQGAWAVLQLGAETIVRAGSTDLQVSGYSVPSYCDWNNDDRQDLVVGEGGGTPGKVRVYLNTGTAAAPQFSAYSYAQANNVDLSVTAGGCLGAFPRTTDWNGDGRKDLLIGRSDGTMMLYGNTNTDADPRFAAGTYLQVGAAGQKTNIAVGGRATPCVADWNNDGKKDLVVGAMDGYVRLYLNQGSDAAPDFVAMALAQSTGGNLLVGPGRSSPVVLDLNDDGRKDLLVGDTNGELLLYPNVGTDAAPVFGAYTAVTAAGVPIDLAGSARSRPFVCDWTGDGQLDVLIGAGDGKVHLYQGVPEPGSLLLLLLAAAPLLCVPRHGCQRCQGAMARG